MTEVLTRPLGGSRQTEVPETVLLGRIPWKCSGLNPGNVRIRRVEKSFNRGVGSPNPFIKGRFVEEKVRKFHNEGEG